MSIPRPEHPKPQFQRENWINLNGRWTFEFDFGKSGVERGLQDSKGFEREIVVPFCPESRLSGVGHTDFIEAMWYHRKIEIPSEWAGQRVLLHFGAVDYWCEAFVDGGSAGTHRGGTVSFSLDITSLVTAGKVHDLVLHVRDELRSGAQPGGKQCHGLHSRGCHYTRTTGIWQTVWLEALSPTSLLDCQIIPDLDSGAFVFVPRFRAIKEGLRLEVEVKGDQSTSTGCFAAVDGVPATVQVENPESWSPESPFLYDIALKLLDGENVVDQVQSYAGLRKVHVEGNRIFLNNAPYYLRLVLDQGFYPDGIWTAPSDGDLKKDIELSLAAGFNGARLHQKVFEERFHYWADKLGYLTWGESASWGLTCFRGGHADETDSNRLTESGLNFLTEWREIVMRDRNHPSIIAWTPFNETRGAPDWGLHHRLHREAYDLCKGLDPTRPVNDTSGYVHVKTDLWTVHTYEQDPEKLCEKLTPQSPGQVWRNFADLETSYQGQPYLVDEFGGIKWNPGMPERSREKSWGYGQAPKTVAEFHQRLQGQVDVVLAQDHVCGYCYTQLTDVEQEQNGIYRYDRSGKFDMERIKGVFGKNPTGKATASVACCD